MNKTDFARVAGVSTQTLLSHIRLLQSIMTHTHTHTVKNEIYLNKV